MRTNINELKKMIVYKNMMLENLYKDSDSDSDKIYQLRTELDSLLYMFYKEHRCTL